MHKRCNVGAPWQPVTRAHQGDLAHFPLVPARYDLHGVTLPHMHGYPHGLAILVQVVVLPLLAWALQPATSPLSGTAYPPGKIHTHSKARGSLTKALAWMGFLQAGGTCASRSHSSAGCTAPGACNLQTRPQGPASTRRQQCSRASSRAWEGSSSPARPVSGYTTVHLAGCCCRTPAFDHPSGHSSQMHTADPEAAQCLTTLQQHCQEEEAPKDDVLIWQRGWRLQNAGVAAFTRKLHYLSCGVKALKDQQQSQVCVAELT